jgi:hypothetical protein
MAEHANSVMPATDMSPSQLVKRGYMQAIQVENIKFIGADWAEPGRKSATLHALHRSKLRPAAAFSGWGTDVAGSDRRSVHASLHRKGDLRVTWWNLYSRLYTAVVPGADLERSMYSFHRMHHAITLSWLGSVEFCGVVSGYVMRFVVRHLPVLG